MNSTDLDCLPYQAPVGNDGGQLLVQRFGESGKERFRYLTNYDSRDLISFLGLDSLQAAFTSIHQCKSKNTSLIE